MKFLEGLDQSNLVLFRITSEQKCNLLLSALKADKVPYKVINNYKLKEEKVIRYVYQNLNITKSDAKYLCTRSGYYLPEVVKNVQTLKVLAKTIKRKCPKGCFLFYFCRGRRKTRCCLHD